MRLIDETEYQERLAKIPMEERTFRKAVEVAEDMPTIEAEPVKHSQWKYYRKQGKAVCMSCSFERNLDDNFGRAVACPNCGARMDGDSK